MAISWTNNSATVTVNVPNPLNTIYATEPSITFTLPKLQVKITGTGEGYLVPPVYIGLDQSYSNKKWEDLGASGLVLKYGNNIIKRSNCHSTKSVAKDTYVDMAYGIAESVTLSTADYFNENNKTTRSITLNYIVEKWLIAFYTQANNQDYGYYSENPSDKTLNNITLTLNVSPTATVSSVSFDTSYVYAGMTTASVTVADATAYYGGDIDSVTLTIGGQSASISGDGTLSILLNAGGTFTPVVRITDSRGQTKDYTLDPITVSIYSTPTANFDAERTTDTGVLDDEGAYATIVTTLTFDPIAEAVAPSVSVTDEDGITQTVTTTWYSSRASDGILSSVISDWSTVASGSTIYGLISITDGFSTVLSYNISVTPIDNKNITGLTITDILQTAFYTVDFLAGGHGIAFGQPCAQEGFFCNIDAHFINYSKVMHSIFDIFYPKGSYYETHLPYTINGHSYDDDNLTNSEIALCGETWFDPRIAWGGTWVLETEGQVHVSAGTNYIIEGALTNETDGGEVTHTLTIAEMPSHTHIQNQHRHSMGNLWSNGSGSDTKYTMESKRVNLERFTGYTTPTNQNTGGSQAHNNMQPYIVVYRWHRTA